MPDFVGFVNSSVVKATFHNSNPQVNKGSLWRPQNEAGESKIVVSFPCRSKQLSQNSVMEINSYIQNSKSVTFDVKQRIN